MSVHLPIYTSCSFRVVMDLSTDAFLAAFRRFTARRVCPGDLYSDNGSNYIGADREL